MRLAGVGLHCGGPCAASVAPAPPGHGLRIGGTPVQCAAVLAGARATTLRTAAGPVRTVEHLLAALYGLGIDDAEVTVEGGEVPILDGSAGPWLDALAPVDTAGERAVLTLPGRVEVRDGDRSVVAEPAAALTLEVHVDYPGLGALSLVAGLDAFPAIARARTFGFLRDAEVLRAAGLSGGASLDNTLVLDDAGRPLNPGGLRHPDEPVRHKWLDLLGDLALLGAPLRARVVARRSGHALHHQLVTALRHTVPADSRT